MNPNKVGSRVRQKVMKNESNALQTLIFYQAKKEKISLPLTKPVKAMRAAFQMLALTKPAYDVQSNKNIQVNPAMH